MLRGTLLDVEEFSSSTETLWNRYVYAILYLTLQIATLCARANHPDESRVTAKEILTMGEPGKEGTWGGDLNSAPVSIQYLTRIEPVETKLNFFGTACAH